MRGLRKIQNASWYFHSIQGENNVKYGIVKDSARTAQYALSVYVTKNNNLYYYAFRCNNV